MESQVKGIPRREMRPQKPVLVVSNTGIALIPANELSPNVVGWKALGISGLPAAWVPPFFVVDGSSALARVDDEWLGRWIQECLDTLRIEGESVVVRSSGTSETMDERGRLYSETCTTDDILDTIRNLAGRLHNSDAGKVHWIVQKLIRTERKGHLSNERRMSLEPRDWVAEFELQGDRPGRSFRVGIRHWRQGETLSDFDLSCDSETAVSLRLRQVALWGTGISARLHFEWVWSGTELWIVQADIARSTVGVNPHELFPSDFPTIALDKLGLFRIAERNDFERYGKLRNAKLYADLGYEMPHFYLVDDAHAIQEILEGRMPTDIERDLKELTRRPLIIRTDGTRIPREKREMLPRSESLGTVESAKTWFFEKFAPEIKRLGLSTSSLCLIAHHFIPSIAAAWARAEIGSDVVRIESLWGLPEGLYWYSHDTFEVDVNGNQADRVLAFRKRRRYKGTFIAPDPSGRWIHYRPRAPYDWGRSISKREWISEIALTTKRVAAKEKHAVSLMWFVDNDPRASKHPVLPWFHFESAIGAPKAAPLRKLLTTSDFKVETASDWERIKTLVREGKRIERVRLEPQEPELVRNQEFARELALFAAENRIVVELAGGILSHAYYILQRNGAQVECLDLFGSEEVVEYNKLVRDRVPELIKRKGEAVEIVQLKGEALLAALRQKLVEECFEAFDARTGDELIGELADVQEVISGICEALKVSQDQIDSEQVEKRERRGGFSRGLMLKTTSTPRTLPPKGLQVPAPSLSIGSIPDIALIEHPGNIPSSRPYRRPDVRNVDQQQESLLTFRTELQKLGDTRESTVFGVELGDNAIRDYRLTVEMKRERSVLWSQIRVRPEPSQIPMKLTPDNQLQLFSEEEGPDEGAQ